ncbi:MAG: zf-HC2 domain-containing protein [Acidobacteria bacterium]|nr:zf-HC2 domain-containing protein [Acidobacteriota bacterium]
MSTHFHCDDTETLVAYLYDDIDPVMRDAVARHLTGCARCRDEVAALGGVRQVLSEWTPPSPALRFTVVPEDAVSNVVRPPVSAWQSVPRWAQAIAAMLALAVGASVANVQVRHDAAGWTVSTGWMSPTPSATAAAAPGAEAAWRPALASLEESLRREFAARPALVAPVQVTTAAAPAAASDSAETLARVRALIESSEKRQQQELALRLTQFVRDVELQRRADLVKINQGLGQLEGRTGAEVERQREAINYLIRAGLRPQQ